jgi:hypothetical protein
MKNETDPMKISQVRSSLLKQKVNNSILKEPFSSIFVFFVDRLLPKLSMF